MSTRPNMSFFTSKIKKTRSLTRANAQKQCSLLECQNCCNSNYNVNYHRRWYCSI